MAEIHRFLAVYFVYFVVLTLLVFDARDPCCIGPAVGVRIRGRMRRAERSSGAMEMARIQSIQSGGPMMLRRLAVVAVFASIWAGVALRGGPGTSRTGSGGGRTSLVLADDKLEGRNTGSAGHRKAAEYVAREFERAGLKPAGTEGYLPAGPADLPRDRRGAFEPDARSRIRARGAAGPGHATRSSARGSSRPRRSRPSWSSPAMACRSPRRITTTSPGWTSAASWWSFLAGAPPSIPGPLAAHMQSAGRAGRAARSGWARSASSASRIPRTWISPGSDRPWRGSCRR